MHKTSIIMLVGGVIFAIGFGLKFTDIGVTSEKNNIYIPRNAAERSTLLKTPNLSWQQMQSTYAPSKGIEDWRKLIPETQWRKDYSAYELASSWTTANPNLPDEIAALFNNSTKLLSATPEHETPLPGGKTPSKSDVLAFIRTKGKVCAVAVEGKVKEDFGEKVGKWLENASDGKITRLQHISEKLGLSYPPADEIRYQLLHRAAAAVIEAERFNVNCAAIIIHSFDKEQHGFEDFVAFLDLFGITSVKPGKLYQSTQRDIIPLSFGWATTLPPQTTNYGYE